MAISESDIDLKNIIERKQRKMSKKEMVNHPEHYQGKKFEVIDIIEDYNLGFNLGNALKYILRCEKKANKKQDIEKAIWYLNREISGNCFLCGKEKENFEDELCSDCYQSLFESYDICPICGKKINHNQQVCEECSHIVGWETCISEHIVRRWCDYRKEKPQENGRYLCYICEFDFFNPESPSYRYEVLTISNGEHILKSPITIISWCDK